METRYEKIFKIHRRNRTKQIKEYSQYTLKAGLKRFCKAFKKHLFIAENTFYFQMKSLKESKQTQKKKEEE